MAETPPYSGPWVQMALFCEKVIRDERGVLTLVSIIDQIIVRAIGHNPPDEMPAFVPEQPLFLVIGLKSGSARGRSTLRIDREDPRGLTETGPSQSVHFATDFGGHQHVIELRVPFELEGTYWFNVLINDHLMTRIPLVVKYAPRTA